MALCISITSIPTEISTEPGFSNITYLKTEISVAHWYTGFKDLKSHISAAYDLPPDSTGPYIVPETYPLDNAGGIGVYGPIFIVVEDLISGIDQNSLELTVNSVGYTNLSSEVDFLPINTPYRYAIRYTPSTAWGLDTEITVSIFIKDKAGNPGMVDLSV